MRYMNETRLLKSITTILNQLRSSWTIPRSIWAPSHSLADPVTKFPSIRVPQAVGSNGNLDYDGDSKLTRDSIHPALGEVQTPASNNYHLNRLSSVWRFASANRLEIGQERGAFCRLSVTQESECLLGRLC